MTEQERLALGDTLERFPEEMQQVFGCDVDAIWALAENDFEQMLQKLAEYIEIEDTDDKFYEFVSGEFDIWFRKDK